MNISKSIYITNRIEWREWLLKNHNNKNEIWLIYYKKHSGKQRIPYEDAVEEAICFGWIDSTIKKIDEEKYAQKFTPRKKKSIWSELNVNRAFKMINENKMTEIGLAKFNEWKKKNKINTTKKDSSNKEIIVPSDVITALKSNKTAMHNFNNLANSYKRNYIGWITSSKKEETRKKRIKEAINLQKELSKKVLCYDKPKKIDYIAGVDIAYDKNSNLGFCAIVIFGYPNLEIIKIYHSYDKIQFPYIPGLLSFREGPLFLKTYKKIKHNPDIFIFDGQGIAHPRKVGIATHMGLLINTSTIGCAKSKLFGNFEEPFKEKGSKSYLYDSVNNKIGIVLRTRYNVKPIFISPGHLIGINESADIIIKCVTKYRIPEPVRIADIEVSKYKKSILKI